MNERKDFRGPAEADPLDGILDRALASYTAGEPSPELAARITAALPAEAPAAPRRARAWVFAAAGWVAAAAALLLWIHTETLKPIAPRSAPVVSQAASTSASSAVAEALPPAPVIHPATARRATAPSAESSFEPISIAPIRMQPIRFEAANEERP